ncbi:hypothetical protein JB92DRAFT_2952136, partial [Gautieria morchelliformis]
MHVDQMLHDCAHPVHPTHRCEDVPRLNAAALPHRLEAEQVHHKTHIVSLHGQKRTPLIHARHLMQHRHEWLRRVIVTSSVRSPNTPHRTARQSRNAPQKPPTAYTQGQKIKATLAR